MISLLANRLNDTDPAVRRTAARHLARARTAVAPTADRIAAALDDPDPAAGLPLAAAPLASGWQPPYAERLAPVVMARLAGMSNGWQRLRCDLLQGVSHWGEHGAGAVGLLTELLSVPNSDRTTVVSCLARIGPPAAAAAPILDRLAADAEPGLLAAAASNFPGWLSPQPAQR